MKFQELKEPLPGKTLNDGYTAQVPLARRDRIGRTVAVVKLYNGVERHSDEVALGVHKEHIRYVDTAVVVAPTVDRVALFDALRALATAAPTWLPSATAATGDDSDDNDDATPDNSQTAKLVRLADAAGWECFHDPEGTAYVSFIGPKGERQNHKATAKAARLSLQGMFWKETSRAARTQAVQDALAILQSKALFDGPCHPVHIRVAGDTNTIYIDLANDAWDVIEVDATGYRVRASTDVPIRFRRTRGMLALPHPVPGGSIDDLKPFLNARGDAFTLEIAWLIDTFKPLGPYPILNIHGEQGTGKSVALRVLRALIDPSVAALRGQPRNEENLMLDALNAWIVAFDNLSDIPPWFSDAMCRLSTGGGSSTREHYSNEDQFLIDTQRPSATTGIEEYGARPDYLDRSIVVVHQPIGDEEREDESDFWGAFEEMRPGILGALLTGVSAALRNWSTTRLAKKPRMADFARWVVAAEGGLGWPEGTFLTAYTQNRSEAVDLALESSVVAGVLKTFMRDRDHWAGTAVELLAGLTSAVDDATRTLKDWPKKPVVLSNTLRRLAPDLRASGIHVDMARTGKKRVITLTRGKETPDVVTVVTEGEKSSQSSPNEGKSSPNEGKSSPNEGKSSPNEGKSSPENASRHTVHTQNDDCDDCDDPARIYSPPAQSDGGDAADESDPWDELDGDGSENAEDGDDDYFTV